VRWLRKRTILPPVEEVRAETHAGFDAKQVRAEARRVHT
jgi:hypothetical protein